MKDSNTKNENVRVATIKMPRWVNILVKGSKEQLDQAYSDLELYEDYSNEAIKEAIELNVGENNVYIEDMLLEYDAVVICNKYVDKEWLKNKSVNYIEEQLKDVVKESGWFDDAEKETA